MPKLTLNNISNINASPSAETTINANNDAIEAAFENTLSRDGSTPNTMGANLDMNSYKIVNNGAPTNNGDAATKKYVDDLAKSANSLFFLDGADSAVAISDTDRIPVVQGSETEINKATGAQLREYTSEVIPTKTWAQPIGRYGVGTVPSNLIERFRHVANAKTDFGVQLYNNAADTGGGVKDNRAALQAAIDAVQKMGGAIFIPPDERAQAYGVGGQLFLRDTTGYKYKSVGIVGIRPGDWTRGLRNSFAPVGEKFDFGSGIKLLDGSNCDFITSPTEAGHLYIEDLFVDANEFGQTGNWKAINIEDSAASYAFSLIAKNLNVVGAGAEGIFIGANRAMTLMEDVWVQYCGRAGGAPAVNVRSYDIQIIRPGIGMNRGTGLFVGGSAQFEMHGGALWENQTNMDVGAGTLSLMVMGTHFDGALQHNLIVNRYTTDERPSSRVFTSCMFSRRPNDYVNNTFDDVSTNDNRLVLIAPHFNGNATTSPVTSATKRSRFNIGFTASDARAVVVGELVDLTAVSGGGFRSVFSGFTNQAQSVVRMGPIQAFNNRFNGNTEIRTRANFDYFGMFHDDGTAVASIASGANGKHGLLRLHDASGNVVFSAGNHGSVRARWADLPVFANDAAAGAAGLQPGDLYILTATRAVTSKS